MDLLAVYNILRNAGIGHPRSQKLAEAIMKLHTDEIQELHKGYASTKERDEKARDEEIKRLMNGDVFITEKIKRVLMEHVQLQLDAEGQSIRGTIEWRDGDRIEKITETTSDDIDLSDYVRHPNPLES